MRKRKPVKTSGTVRIIAGDWRGRKLSVPDLPGLRPTPDRVRETLFNWLAPQIAGARCLDLFAGSGALGLEALSRGAGFCQFVDADPGVCARIQAHLQLLGATARARCQQGRAEVADLGAEPWDVVFVDPPFADQLVEPTLSRLLEPGMLATDGRIYVETAINDSSSMPGAFTTLREKTAGGVRYRLLQHHPPA